ncbi:MAG TPA: GNAT family N-acetyltransferase [Pseudomonas xinjiangensis]|uniref:GNAT family N-acetyltransferase n=2 Tax=root TaxID=1 RepID=A0A7V1FSR9_9GAMM|nr:GNAT family N-acetyltransferase [Halopseudomonas xinjiangensis]HEC48478.1 GNAT family N-acetyltransferase [Halopseudomonas xinjiangensis]
MSTSCFQADYHDPDHASAIVRLLDAYAQDPMGGGEPLSEEVKLTLAGKLAALPHAFSVLCYVDGQPAGLVNCFEGFSSFVASPLVNIHDVVVSPAFRGLGVSQLMLAEVERIAIERGCCKLTLEVLEGNRVAQGAYEKCGFSGYQLDPAMGHAMFWQKSL